MSPDQTHEPTAYQPISPRTSSEQSNTEHPESHDEDQEDQEDQYPILRYRKRSIYLLLVYVPLLVIPWVLTCILAGKPPLNGMYGSPDMKHFPQTGLSARGVLSMLAWVAAVRTLNSIASVATVPVTSALLAQAAVVYTQKRKPHQALNMRQTFVLADRRWADVSVLVEAYRRTGAGMGSRFLWLGMCLIFLSAVQHPLQQLLVSWESVPVMTCLDDPVRSCGPPSSYLVGYDPEPGDMATLRQNQVVQEVTSSLANFNDLNFETHLWPDPSYLHNESTAGSDPPARQMLRYWTGVVEASNFFVTALQNGTQTGVLRQHAMRFNSSVQCKRISKEEFPSPCSGERPFNTSFSNNLLEIRVCAPGEYGVNPWTLSRNRQDITEHLYIDSVDNRDERSLHANTTIHCEASTTRGYFELGNHRNGGYYGPLLEKWPEPEELAKDFNDDLSPNAGAGSGPPTESDETKGQYNDLLNVWPTLPDPFATQDLDVSGPLMTSAIVLFGNQSFFQIAKTATNETAASAMRQICHSGLIPFSWFDFTAFAHYQSACAYTGTSYGGFYTHEEDAGLSILLGDWIYRFNDTTGAEQALAASMYFTNRAMLTQTTAASWLFSARKIFYGPGMMVPFPAKTVAGTVIVTVIIFIQLIGLAFVTYYIYHVPTWSPALDAVAVARIGASMDRADLPALGENSRFDESKLTQLDGVVGLAGEDESHTRLELGGQGVITRRHAIKPKKSMNGNSTPVYF